MVSCTAQAANIKISELPTTTNAPPEAWLIIDKILPGRLTNDTFKISLGDLATSGTLINITNINPIQITIDTSIFTTNGGVLSLVLPASPYLIYSTGTSMQASPWQRDSDTAVSMIGTATVGTLRANDPGASELFSGVTNWGVYVSPWASNILAVTTGTNNLVTAGHQIWAFISDEPVATNCVLRLPWQGDGYFLTLVNVFTNGALLRYGDYCWDDTNKFLFINGDWQPTQQGESIDLLGSAGGWTEKGRHQAPSALSISPEFHTLFEQGSTLIYSNSQAIFRVAGTSQTLSLSASGGPGYISSSSTLELLANGTGIDLSPAGYFQPINSSVGLALGAGTNYWGSLLLGTGNYTDDGTHLLRNGVPLAGGSGTTINSTDGVIPVRGSATTFTNSPLVVVNGNVLITNNATFGTLGASTSAIRFQANSASNTFLWNGSRLRSDQYFTAPRFYAESSYGDYDAGLTGTAISGAGFFNNRSNLLNTLTSGLQLKNPVASVTGVREQNSPSVEWIGSSYDSTLGNMTLKWDMFYRARSNDWTTSTIDFSLSTNNVTYLADLLSIHPNGTISIQGRTNRIGDNGAGVTYNGSLIGGGGGTNYWTLSGASLVQSDPSRTVELAGTDSGADISATAFPGAGLSILRVRATNGVTADSILLEADPLHDSQGTKIQMQVGSVEVLKFAPDIGDGSVPYFVDTPVAHTSADLFDVRNLGTNIFSVSPLGVATVSDGTDTVTIEADSVNNFFGTGIHVDTKTAAVFELSHIDIPGTNSVVFASSTSGLSEFNLSYTSPDAPSAPSGVRATASYHSADFTVSVDQTNMVALKPTVGATNTPFRFDTTVEHTSGNQLEVANLHANVFVVYPDGTISVQGRTNRLGDNGTSPTYNGNGVAVGSFMPIAGGTFTGSVGFSGTTEKFTLPNLTTAQKNALTPAAGDMVFDTDLGRFQAYDGAAWHSRVRLDGDTMTGTLTVTGLTNSARTASTFVVAAADKSDTSTATSSVLATTLSDETGTGSVVFSASPALTGTATLVNGTVSGNLGSTLAVGDTGWVDMTKASQTNSVSGTLTLSYATNGTDLVSLTHVRWLFNGSGSDQTLSIPSGWRTNIYSAVPTKLTNATITKMVIDCGGPTSSAALQTNVYVSFEYYK